MLIYIHIVYLSRKVIIRYIKHKYFLCSLPLKSLNNLSDDVRWSLDLRWQRSDQPVGFYGLKEGVVMRSSAGPVDIAWEEHDSTNRHEAQKDYVQRVRLSFWEDTTFSNFLFIHFFCYTK